MLIQVMLIDIGKGHLIRNVIPINQLTSLLLTVLDDDQSSAFNESCRLSDLQLISVAEWSGHP